MMEDGLIRERLHRQIDHMPDDLVKQVADFALFLLVKQKGLNDYEDWGEKQWQEFALQYFYYEPPGVEGKEIEYSLKDAKEIYHT
jgi:hypothetical protein